MERNFMQYGHVISGRFLARPNRFIAHVETEDGIEIVQVKNTGRCRDLLVPGATVSLEQGTNPNRHPIRYLRNGWQAEILRRASPA